jgi:hypothetical protein
MTTGKKIKLGNGGRGKKKNRNTNSYEGLPIRGCRFHYGVVTGRMRDLPVRAAGTKTKRNAA